MKRILINTIFISLLLIMATASLADAKQGRAKADTCLGCHGVPSYTNVYPTYQVPKLAGQHKEYLVAAMKAYQSGERAHKTMRAQTIKLSDEDIDIIADFFSQLPSKPGNPDVKPPADIEEQAAICTACHNADGNSPIPAFPKLAGQREAYLYESLKSYKTGERTNPIMLGIVEALEDGDMKKLSRFFASNQGLGVISIKRTVEE